MILRTQIPFPNHVLTPPRYRIKNRSSSIRVHFSVNYSSYLKETTANDSNKDAALPTMTDILSASRAQNLNLQLQTLGPFFRITMVRVWLDGKILHLDSIRLKRESLGMEKSIFGIGLFIGAVAIRHGYVCGCKTAQLLAINDSDVYHSKLVRFYRRIGFEALHEVTGGSIGDLAHMLVWGGIGTRMNASVEQLLVKWCSDSDHLVEQGIENLVWYTIVHNHSKSYL